MLEAIVLCKNEADNLSKCLPHLKFADSLLVIDDYSTDDSVKVAKSFGARVIRRHLSGDFAAARNFALKHTRADWVLFVDSDEIVPPKLQNEILDTIAKNISGGYYLRRLDFFKNIPLYHGDVGNFKVLRLQKKPFTPFEGLVHEVWTQKDRNFTLKNYIFHYSHNSIYGFLHKINQYSQIRSEELFAQKSPSSLLHIIFYPMIKFFYLYFFRLGILDGTIGLIHALMMSFYTFLVRAKLFMLWKKGSSLT